MQVGSDLCSPEGRAGPAGETWGLRKSFLTSSERWEPGGAPTLRGGEAAAKKAVGRGHSEEAWRKPAPVPRGNLYHSEAGGAACGPVLRAQPAIRALGKRGAGKTQRHLGICGTGTEGFSGAREGRGPARRQRGWAGAEQAG